ncbi:tail fiber protein [Chromobacterium vaccinii]|uniref:Phage tail collar domain-containing protein n=1 Tax=Chromobacterium vaccinii TaxID=1108595 RepID=A0A1D9LI53_9NEIS|nr:tail fiber protein [Chromobacterium vaccinii]AOZ50949.1 hypothetical protein BKX93_13755 [Chromobacterium vaccinii]
MQDQLKSISTPDSLFHDGNPATGELGTVVTADWLNSMQSAVQSTQQELLAVINSNNGQKADPTRQDQLLQAMRNISWGGNNKPTTLAGYGIAIASQAEAEAGTDNVKAMTPLRVEQALNALGLSGYAKVITSGSLQAVRPNGLYHIDSNLVSGTPDKSNGMLLVNFLNDKWGSQVYWMWGGATYEQRLENGNWQPWVKLLKTGQQSTLADYGITDAASKTDLQKAVNDLVAGAPGALNTLQELAAALGNDANYAASITKQLSGKADKATTLSGYGISDAFPLRPPLGAGVDLNTVQDTGIFHQPRNANISTGQNYPAELAGMLMVYSSESMVYQIYLPYDGSNISWRVGYNKNWSIWKRSVDSTYVDTKAKTEADRGRDEAIKSTNKHFPGQLVPMFTSKPPAGLLICNGAAVSRDIYPDLFSAIGTTYGAGDGTKTFNLPNIPDGFAMLAANGTPVGAITQGEIKSHAHATNSSVDEAGGHLHGMNLTSQGGNSNPAGAVASAGYNWTGYNPSPMNIAGAHTHNITVNIQATGSPNNYASGMKVTICIAY